MSGRIHPVGISADPDLITSIAAVGKRRKRIAMDRRPPNARELISVS